MAEATHAIADRCEDARMLDAYLELAAQWIRMAEMQPPCGGRRSSEDG